MGLNLGHEKKKKKKNDTLVLKMTNLASTDDLEKNDN